MFSCNNECQLSSRVQFSNIYQQMLQFFCLEKFESVTWPLSILNQLHLIFSVSVPVLKLCSCSYLSQDLRILTIITHWNWNIQIDHLQTLFIFIFKILKKDIEAKTRETKLYKVSSLVFDIYQSNRYHLTLLTLLTIFSLIELKTEA